MTKQRISHLFDLKKDADGRKYMEVHLDGIALLRLVLCNKGTAFTLEERVALRLDGLLPPQVTTLEQQVERVYKGFSLAPTAIDKYQFLRALQERQEILFFALLERHLEDMLPIVYTPTVGEAVEHYSALYQNPRGLSFTPLNIERAKSILDSYPMEDVRMIVATDSSAILGIGDQGYGGLAIPIGKLAIYTAGGGVSPFHTMPVALDVGTERTDLIDDPNYLGFRDRRLRGDDYTAFVDRFVEAVRVRWPRAVVQWEDLAKDTAFAVLERYRHTLPSFNDDIQGTGAMALAGLMSACALKGEALTEQRFVVHGAGAGGVGVALAVRSGLEHAGLSREEASARIFVLDSKGLLLSDRALEPYKEQFAHDRRTIEGWEVAGYAPTLLETVKGARATVLLGLSGRRGAFDEATVRAAAANTERPIIFPLSNPTASTEALPADVLEWTGGRAIIATGSPFEPVVRDGKRYRIGQGNNAFIFPGLGFGAILSYASEITDGMVYAAAEALAEYTIDRYVREGLIYPPVDDIQETSVRVATRVVTAAIREGVARRRDIPDEVEAFVRRRFWRAEYQPFVRGPQLVV